MLSERRQMQRNSKWINGLRGRVVVTWGVLKTLETFKILGWGYMIVYIYKYSFCSTLKVYAIYYM